MRYPIDNKNLMEDPFEDEVFCDNFFAARDHRESGVRHLIGKVDVYDEEFPKCVNYTGIVDVSWFYGGNTVTIKVLAVLGNQDFDESRDAIFEMYEKLFKSWECEENENLVIHFGSEKDSLYVHFYWSVD